MSRMAILCFMASIVAMGCQSEGPGELDWPPLTMRYQWEGIVGHREGIIEFKLTYHSRNHWREEVVSAPVLDSPAGPFTIQGSHVTVREGLVIQYDPNSDDTHTQVLESGIERHPGMNTIAPTSMEKLRRIYGREPVAVETNTLLCFQDVCQENAAGWSYDALQWEVYADDLRGIPIKLHEVGITEVRVHSAQQPLGGQSR